MTIKEYTDFKYNVEKEYQYYLNTFGRYDKDKEKYNYYKNLKRAIHNFETKAIEKELKRKNVTKEDLIADALSL